LNEVIQVGYGTVKKKDATGAVSQILLRTLIKGKRNPESLISGRIAGVNVTGGHRS
jgi:iron complex outermembrane receptor protein